ncbi:MAG TPA: hypothetical protein VG796_03800 [Verrucomicrobiales bacterium]|nr:hypothetical protein [Verrucomicrobiales bacterium]
MIFSRRRFLVGTAALALPRQLTRADVAAPAWRLAPEGWGKASATDIKAVIESAVTELWRYFPGRKLEPFLVLRGRQGPIVQYRRNSRKEIVVLLDTQDLYWCQYTYQIAHEFCHILCNYDDDWKGNLWFEESLCETASLFVLRKLAQTWAKNAPYDSWRAYAPRFSEYAEDVMDRRVSIPDSKLASFYQRHQSELVKNPVDRELNGTFSLSLLRMLEANPQQWEAVTWLNSSPSPQGETFSAYLNKWCKAAPDRCREFIKDVMKRFGVTPA